MTRILYISTLDPIAPRAHVYNTLQTVAHLATYAEVRIAIPERTHAADSGRHIREYLGIADAIPFLLVPSLGTRLAGSASRYLHWVEMLLQSLSFCRLLWRERHSYDWVYLRDFALFIPALFARYVLGKHLAYEVHAVLHARGQEIRNSLLVRHAHAVIAITDALRDHFLTSNPHIVTIVCAAAEPERFAAVHESREALRRAFDLPQEATILGYTGNMGRTGNNDPYGIEEIVDALPLLPPQVLFVGYGKRDKETAPLEAYIGSRDLGGRALIRGHVSKTDVYRFLRACDILVIPSAGNQIGNAPSKTYEYLASGLPIVAAQTTANSEVLEDGVSALLVDAKDPTAWAHAIQSVGTVELRDRLVRGALAEAQEYTWGARARKILDHLAKSA